MMQGLLAIDDLRLVAMIGAAGSLSGAAKRLAVDHSTAFRRLGALEQRVGARLFERGRDGYAPTPAGELTIASAARILGELEGLERRLAGEDLRPSGILRVTTADTLVDFLAPMFRDFRSAHPEITVELIVASAFLTLTRRDADIAIRPAADPGSGLVGRNLGPIIFAIYGRRDRFARGAESSADAEWIGFDDSLSHLHAAQWVAEHVAPERIVLRANTLSAMQTAARSGLGLALLPCFQCDPDPLLERVSDPIAELETPLWLLTHPDLRRVARVRAFLDFAAPAISDQLKTVNAKHPGKRDNP